MGRRLLHPRNAADSLQAALDSLRAYIEDRCPGEMEPVFTNSTGFGLLFGVGEHKFMFSPYREGLGPASELPSFLSLEQLKELELRVPSPVVDGLIFAGELVLFAGRPKVGKTRLTHQLAVAIVTGTEFLGMKVPTARRVLLVDLENRRWAVKNRFIKMVGEDDNVPGLFIWCADSLHKDIVNSKEAGVRQLSEMIGQTGAEVIVIDPWRLWVGGDENSAENVVAGLRALSTLRESRPDLTIIIVHHVRKDRFETPRNLRADPRSWIESISGHYALTSHVDACFGLERQKEDDGDEVIAFGGVARNVDPLMVLLEDDEQSLRFDVRQGEAALKSLLTPAEYKLWVVTASIQAPMGFNQLVERTGSTNRKAVDKMLKQAVRCGLLLKENKRYVLQKPLHN